MADNKRKKNEISPEQLDDYLNDYILEDRNENRYNAFGYSIDLAGYTIQVTLSAN